MPGFPLDTVYHSFVVLAGLDESGGEGLLEDDAVTFLTNDSGDYLTQD